MGHVRLRSRNDGACARSALRCDVRYGTEDSQPNDDLAVRSPSWAAMLWLPFAKVNGERREPLFVSDSTAQVLELSGRGDGLRTVLEMRRTDAASTSRRSASLEQSRMFVRLAMLHDSRVDRAEELEIPMQISLSDLWRCWMASRAFTAHSRRYRAPFLRVNVRV